MKEGNNPEVLVKQLAMPIMMAPARYEQVVTLHQGHIERVFREDMKRYGSNDVQYRSKLVDMKIDDGGCEGFPVLATIEKDGKMEEVRTKNLVGADGASRL